MSTERPAPDRDEIHRTLEVLFAPEDVIELRVLRRKGKYTSTWVGYFDALHRAQLIEEAARFNEKGFQVYVPFNAIDPQLLGRCANRMEEGGQATADSNILQRRYLLIDIDPRRPDNTSATAEQLQTARAVAQEVRAFLREKGGRSLPSPCPETAYICSTALICPTARTPTP